MVVTDMDGNQVSTDDFIWNKDDVNDNSELPIIGNVFTTTEGALIDTLIKEYAEVFSPVLVPGGAKVEPMRIVM